MVHFIYNLGMNYPLSEKITYIIKTLNDHGFEANIVGGCVRDILLKRHPSDFDINTDATPAQVLEVFKNHRIYKTGLKHGTVSLVLNNETFEITSYRTDGEYTDFRHPEKVEFSSDLRDDLARRDFTINAIAYNSKDGLLDFHHGYEDLKNKIIRCVGDPEIRLKEDALRILRAIRFACTLNFKIEEETRKVIFKKKHLLLNIAIERIYIELLKTLTGKYVADNLPLYKEIIEVFIPEFRYVARYRFVESLNHLSKEKKDKSVILAIFLQAAEGYQNILKRLKVDNKTYQEVSLLIENYYQFIEADDIAIRFNLHRMGKEMFAKLLKFQYLTGQIDKAYYDICLSILKYIEVNKLPYQLKDLSVDGNDIQSLGYEGKEIAQQLNRLLSLVIKYKLKNTKEDLMKYLKNSINKRSRL